MSHFERFSVTVPRMMNLSFSSLIYIEDVTRWREDMNFIFEWQKCHEKIKLISSSRRVMFFLLYRQKDIDKIIEGNYRNYVIDKLTCEIMENKPLGSRMQFL